MTLRNAESACDSDSYAEDKKTSVAQLIDQATRDWETYKTNPEGVTLASIIIQLNQAIDLRSAEAMYMLANFYLQNANDLPEPKQHEQKAIKLYEAAYAAGYKPAIKNLIFCYQSILQVHKKAYHYLKIDADEGNCKSQYEVALRKIAGMGTTQDYKGAFYYLWHAAVGFCADKYGDIGHHYAAQMELSKFYVSGLLFPRDNVPALFWAVLTQNFMYDENNSNYINGLMEQMDKADIIECQQEAYKYADHLDKVAQGHSALIMTPLEYYEKHGYNKVKANPDAPSEKDNPAKMSMWKVPDASQLSITLNYNDKAITAVFRYGNHKQTFPIARVFSKTYQNLLFKYFQFLDGQKAQISYSGHDLCEDGRNPNHYYVEHFNTHLRKLVGAGSSFKPFIWIGTRGSKAKGLKANFTLKVYS